MHNFEDMTNLEPANEKKTPWDQIVLGCTAVTVTFLGAKLEDYNWILYFTIPILSLSFVLMLLNTQAGKKVKKWIYVNKERKHLSKSSKFYEEFLEKIRIAQKLADKIDQLDWGMEPRPRRPYFSNSINELYNSLDRHQKPTYYQTIMLNHILNIYVEVADGYFKECDHLVIQRKIKYKSERDKTEILKLTRQYEDFKELHDEFCKKINKIIPHNQLKPFYSDTLCFTPKELTYPLS